MNNKHFFISTIIIVSLISILWITITLFTPNKSNKVINSAKIQSMLLKESFTGEFEIKNFENVKTFEEDFKLEIPVYCKETNKTNLNKRNFIKLQISSNKGIEIYHIDNSKGLIKKIYQPNISNKLAESYNENYYSCEKNIIKEYKEKIKNLN